MKLIILNLALILAYSEAFKNSLINHQINIQNTRINRILKPYHDSSLINRNDNYNRKLNAIVSFPSPDLLRKSKAFNLTSLINYFRGFVILSMGMLIGLKSKFKQNIKIATNNALESGWSKRGYGGSMSRTMEVWGFAINFIYKFVSKLYI